jgi:hypothetical protein
VSVPSGAPTVARRSATAARRGEAAVRGASADRRGAGDAAVAEATKDDDARDGAGDGERRAGADEARAV